MSAQAVSRFAIHVEQADGFEFLVRFDKEQFAALRMDEAPPLGQDAAPSAARILAAAIRNCLSASLVFCLKKANVADAAVTADVGVEIVRNENRRLRVGKVDAALHSRLPPDHPAITGCLATFEDFCIVTQSVRNGIDVNVRMEPAAQGGDRDVRAARNVGALSDDRPPIVRGAVAARRRYWPHRDGWGLGLWQDGDALIVREPDAASQSQWVRFLQERQPRTSIAIAHIRRATQGERLLRNPQPFVRELGGRTHLFAHNGTLSGIEEESRFDPRRFRRIGDTDSEQAFCALLFLPLAGRGEQGLGWHHVEIVRGCEVRVGRGLALAPALRASAVGASTRG